MPERDGHESRKKYIDGARSNPKHRKNGQSAAKPRTGEGSTTIPEGSRIKRSEVVCPSCEGEDIVCALAKVRGGIRSPIRRSEP